MGEPLSPFVVGTPGNLDNSIKIYKDPENNIYLKAITGADCKGWLEISDTTDNDIIIQYVELPLSATQL